MITVFKNLSFIVLILCCEILYSQDINTFDHLIQKSIETEFSDWDYSSQLTDKAEKLIVGNSLDSLSRIWNRKAYLNYIKGNTSTAMKLATKVYSNYSSINNLLEALDVIGLVHLTNKRYKLAKYYFETAKEKAEEVNNEQRIGTSLLNLAVIESRLGNYNEAISLEKRAFSFLEKFKHTAQFGILNNQMAYDYYKIDNLDSAEVLFKYNIETAPKKTLWNISYANTGLSLIHQKNKDYALALQYANVSRKYADSLSALRLLELSSKSQYTSAKGLGNNELALKYLIDYYTFRDSLSSIKHNETTEILQAELTEADKAKYAAELAVLNLNKRNYLNIFISLIGFIIFLISVVFFYRKSLKNITELNYSLNKSNELINTKTKELDKLNKDKTRLFSIISHDLRGPFNSVQQILEMIQNGDIETEEKDELMTLLANQVGNTRSMLNELLSWANSQLDESKTEIKPFKLKSVIESVKHLYEDAFTLKSINFTLLVDESDFFVLGDENQIKIILQNLVSNALKFTPSGGEVILRKYQENNALIIEIEDNGIGMKENLISSLNKDSFSNTTNGTQQEEGSGLGLLLVRQFSLNNHIGFHIDSETNKGTLIRLTFREVVQDNNVLAVESYN